MTSPGLILASRSPRRSELLRRLGLEFRVQHPPAGPEPEDPTDPGAGALRAARWKARSMELRSGETVLSADTVVVLTGSILGKPGDPEEARAMLKRLSGRWHQVHTGVAVRRWDGWERSAGAQTRVRFRELAPEEIEAYVAGGEPLDKAGAYAIQGAGALFVERVEGCCSNVVGLPLGLTGQLLREAGLTVLGIPSQ